MAYREPPRPAPTIGELMQPGRLNWFWAQCNHFMSPECRRTAVPMTYARFAILWGLDASSDLIRQRLRCTRCGHRGASTTMPSWGGMQKRYSELPKVPFAS